MSSERYNEEMLLGFLEGDLTPEQTLEFEKLLVEDARLRNLVAQMVLDRHRLRKMPDEQAPAEVMERVNQVLERRMLIGSGAGAGEAPSRLRLWNARWLTMGGMAAGVALMIGWFAMTLTNRSLNEMSNPKRPEALGPVAANGLKGKELATSADAAAKNQRMSGIADAKDGWVGRDEEELNRSVTADGASATAVAKTSPQGPADAAGKKPDIEGDEVRSLWTTQRGDWRANQVWGDNHQTYSASNRRAEAASPDKTAAGSSPSSPADGRANKTVGTKGKDKAGHAEPAEHDAVEVADADGSNLRLADSRSMRGAGGGSGPGLVEEAASNAVAMPHVARKPELPTAPAHAAATAPPSAPTAKPVDADRVSEWRDNANPQSIFLADRYTDDAAIEVTSASIELTQRRLTEWAMTNNLKVNAIESQPTAEVGGASSGGSGGVGSGARASQFAPAGSPAPKPVLGLPAPPATSSYESKKANERQQRQLLVTLPRRQINDLLIHLNEQSGQRAMVQSGASSGPPRTTSDALPALDANRRADAPTKADARAGVAATSPQPGPEHMQHQSLGGALAAHPGRSAEPAISRERAAMPATQPTPVASQPAPALLLRGQDAIIQQRILIIEEAK